MSRIYVDEDALNALLDQAENDTRLRSLVAKVRASVRTPVVQVKKVFKARPVAVEQPVLFDEETTLPAPVTEVEEEKNISVD